MKKHSHKLSLDYEIIDGYYYFSDGQIYSPAEVCEILKLSPDADLAAIHLIKKIIGGTVLNVRKSNQIFQGKKEYFEGEII